MQRNPDCVRGKLRNAANKKPAVAPLLLGRANSHSFRFVKLLLGSGANLFQFGVQPSDFGVQFDKIQAETRDQAVYLSTAMSRAHVSLEAYAGGGQISQWVPVQVNEVKT
jgi:hypothetical protein